MTFHAADLHQEQSDHLPASLPGRALAPTCNRIPALAIDLFCDTMALAAEVELAASDRRMARCVVTRLRGGVNDAINYYRGRPTPNVILLETRSEGEALFAELEALSAVCDQTTKAVLIGRSNDIDTYRALIRRGVSEYLRMPVDAATLISEIARIFSEPAAAKVGRSTAFIGARGGTGSSTLAHNVAWTLGQLSARDVIIADLDLQFGTAALDFDLNPKVTIAEALKSPEQIDDQVLESLLTPCGEHCSILAAPARLDLSGDGDGKVFERLLDLAQTAASHVMIDVPRVWCEWSRKTLIAADEVVITATPDLASMRNTHNLLEMLRRARPHDADPRLVLNQVGVSRRPEIEPALFGEVMGLEPLVTIPFDPAAFGTASNSGRMLASVPKGNRHLAALRKVAEALSGGQLDSPPRAGRLRRLLGRG